MALDTARMEIEHLAAAHADDRTAWESARHALEEALRMATDTLSAERQAWSDERASLANRSEETDHLLRDQRRLQDAINALRSDYASMVQTLEGERAVRERQVRQLEVLQADIAEADRRYGALEQELEQTTVDAEALIRRRELEHQERLRQLEHDLAQGAVRLARMADDADRARAALHAEYTRAAESHNRLVSSDLFGYAVTTLAGELVRCNDTFARLFGFSDAPDALTRTAGQLFAGLAGRTTLLDRLTAEGHVDRVESCLERVDGRPIRVLESLTLLTDSTDETDGETLVEHVMLGSVAGPSAAELQAQRLQEVGALASAMVPEIEGLVSTLLERTNEQDHDRREINALASQATALVRQLGAFSRRQVRTAEPVALNEVVLRAEPMLMRLVGAYIGFSTDLKDTSSVTAAADDLDQLLSSLVTLGRDLLPAGGSILVETRQQSGNEGVDRTDGPMLVVIASGYGVQFPDRPSALEQVAERCNGLLRIAGEPGWQVRLEVTFPRCGGRTSAGWNWLKED
jgi:PAS domain-containing protein